MNRNICRLIVTFLNRKMKKLIFPGTRETILFFSTILIFISCIHEIKAQTACIISGASSFCNGNSTVLTGPNGATAYLWSTGTTSKNITVTTAGTYTLTVTINGNISSCSKSVAGLTKPNCNITGVSSICPGTSTPLCAQVLGAAYSWSTGVTTQCINVNSAGTYFMTITSANGCSSTCSKKITIKTLQSAAIAGNASVCSGSSISLCGSPGRSAYLWNSGETTRCILASNPGTYSLTIIGTNGCTNKSTKTILPGSTPSCCLLGCADTICPGASPFICSPAGLASYKWNTGATTQCIQINSPGYYTITVSNTAGCKSTCTRTVTLAVTNDNNKCTVDVCDTVNGHVTHLPVNFDDNNVCTIDGCDPLTGVFHNPVNIDDQNACTLDDCDPVTGPYHNALNIDDNNVCTIDACDPVNGITHGSINIDDQNACTTDDCDPLNGVAHIPVDANDNNLCTIDACNTLTGVIHTPIPPVDDSNPCTTDICDIFTGQTNYISVNTDDNNACTTDGCDQVTGIFHNLIVCNDNNPCTIDVCNPAVGICTNIPTAESDNNPCTLDVCDALTGITNHTSINIDDNNSCTVDACDLFTGIISHTTFQLNLTATNTTMIGGSNGSVAAAPSGGTPPYTCVWLPNDTTASLTNVGAGTYTVTVTDANGCSVTGTIIVYEPTCPSTTISFTTFLSSSKPGTPTSLWLNIHTKLTAGSLPNNGDFIKITNVNATLNNILSNPAISSMSIPNGKIIADSTVITPSTIYNTSTNEWITRIAPGDTSNDIFITGGIINSSNGFLALTGKNSTVSASWYSNKYFS